MPSQATEFATTFDRLGRRMLAQLESLPQGLWDWVPPNVPSDSLLTLATLLLEESEYLVLVTIGGQKRGDEHMVAVSPPNVRATLLHRYERWVTQMHRLLDRLPDAIMNLLVAVPAPYREMFVWGGVDHCAGVSALCPGAEWPAGWAHRVSRPCGCCV